MSVETAFPTHVAPTIEESSSEENTLDSHPLVGLFRSVQGLVLQTHSAAVQPIRRSDFKSIVACLSNISNQLAVASADITFVASLEARVSAATEVPVPVD